MPTTTINLAKKFEKKVAERYKRQSLTDGMFSTEYSWAGVRTIEIPSVGVVELVDYDRNAASNRYGTPHELGDSIQVLEVKKDVAFTYTVDKGNNEDQMNIKAANSTLRRNIDEVAIPAVDKYRLDKWAHNAGTVFAVNAAKVTKNTITENIMDCTEAMDDAGVPDGSRTLAVSSKYYKLLKQNPDFISAADLGKSGLQKGVVGEIDGMDVRKLPTSYFPKGVLWMVTRKDALLAPQKLKDYKIHNDPPGISGNLVEYREYHDAFVLGAKANGALVCIEDTYQINTPTITNDSNNSAFTVKTTTAGADLYYTTDGSDPRYSNSAKHIGANSGSITYADLNNAATDSNGRHPIRLAAKPNSNTAMFQSGVVEDKTYAN